MKASVKKHRRNIDAYINKKFNNLFLLHTNTTLEKYIERKYK